MHITRIPRTMAVICTCAAAFYFRGAEAARLPETMYFSEDGSRLVQGSKESADFYDETVLRTINLTFSQADWWQQLTNNYVSEVEIPADLAMDGVTCPGVGVRFKGQTSYQQTGTSKKKSFNISLDFTDSTRTLMGYKTLNLNNCYSDASFVREVLYFNICRKYIPCPKANFVKLVINGENWGIYANVQQLNSDFIKEWFDDDEGARWKAPMTAGGTQPGGQPAAKVSDEAAGPQPPGGQPGGQTGGQTGGGIQIFSNITATALTWLGTNVTTYQNAYELKSSKVDDPWAKLISVCNVLNNTTPANLADSLKTVLAVDRCLWFIAMENLFTDEDSYLTKGADYQLYYEGGTGLLHPLQFDGNETFKTNDTNLSPVYGETLAIRPLISRLLAVPELRQRYLAHVRTIMNESLDWTVLEKKVTAYQALIGEEVAADTKKLSTNAQYASSAADLKNMVTARKTYLSGFAEVTRTAPAITSVAREMTVARDIAGMAVRVTAKVTCTPGVGNVYLWYAGGIIGPFDRTAMLDDGAHGDGLAGDGVYGGEIPARKVGATIRFYIEARASDSYATAAFSPAGAEHDVYVCTVSAPVAASSSVVINEVMASNTATIQDPQGEYEDWIELKNIGTSEIDLSGMYVSDDPEKLRKWAIPSGTSLEPGGYLIIWADSDNDSTNTGLHASFKLSAGGESIFLVDSDARGNAILDSLSFAALEKDVSFGRYPDGTGPRGILSKPTPGRQNTVATGVGDADAPSSFRLDANYPNPFNGSTVIGFSVPERAETELSIYSVTGQKIVTLTGGMREAGDYRVFWDGRDGTGRQVASGVYLYRLRSGKQLAMRRLMLLR